MTISEFQPVRLVTDVSTSVDEVGVSQGLPPPGWRKFGPWQDAMYIVEVATVGRRADQIKEILQWWPGDENPFVEGAVVTLDQLDRVIGHARASYRLLVFGVVAGFWELQDDGVSAVVKETIEPSG